MEKCWKPIPANEDKITELQELLNIQSIPARLLLRQGIESKTEAERFLNPSLDHLYDPFRMLGMTKAVERIHEAIEKDERILIYGDYDVDGVTSVTLLFSFLSHFTSNIDYYIPDRYKEGYGVSKQGIDYAAQNGITLIISVDCGIKAVERVREARQRDIDFIICDHHLPGAKLPEAQAILDPKQPDCEYPYKDLSGCGIAFKLAQAYGTANGWLLSELKPFLDLVVVSIASDIVPITGENRVLAYFGLKKLNDQPRLGFVALLKLLDNRAHLKIEDIVFGIGPMLNAAGRIADARQAVRLLLSEDSSVTQDYARLLQQKNELRKTYDQMIVAEATAIIARQPDSKNNKSIVLFHPQWHKGVIGIAASRIVERFYKPTIILTKSNGKAVGSARSIQGFDIYEAIKSCKHLLDSFGGHQYAAGLTMDIDKVDAFRDAFEAAVQPRITSLPAIPEINYFAQLPLSEITPNFWQQLKAFAPFGPGNRNPVFVSFGVEDTGYAQVLKTQHLRLQLRQNGSTGIRAMAFKQAEHFPGVKEQAFHICYTIQENHWNGRTNLQLNIKDIKFGTLG